MSKAPPEPRDTPPGWDYNPASWHQRLPIICLALVGFAIAMYLALYQWRVVGWVWEPFFGGGSVAILNSRISHMLPYPITDAFLGALGYLADAVTGAIGGRSRWRTMPWIVILFGTLVGPLGAVSVLLVILQPVLFGSFCTLCLASATVSVLMIGPGMDEFLASCQHVKRAGARGQSAWRAFWGLAGETPPEEGADGRSRDAARAPSRASVNLPPADGRTATWARLIVCAAGIWLMAAPAVLHYGGVAATHDRIAGPVVAGIACVAISQVTRPVRWIDVVVGLWLIPAPFLLHFPIPATLSSVASGLLIASLSLIRGGDAHRFGGGWRTLLPGRPVPR